MKVKQQPDDFQVEELTELQPAEGPFAFYRLTKKNLGTPEAVQRLCHALRIAPQRVSYGGLKDTHALTTQHLTIHHGPRRDWHKPPLLLKYLGQSAEPFQSQHISCNRFTLWLREFSAQAHGDTLLQLAEVKDSGVANYFDDQRFGSVGAEGHFVARRLIDEDYEGALHLALCAPYAFDRPAEKETKRLLHQSWGDWSRLRALLPPGHVQRIAAHLSFHPQDFRGAILQLPHSQLTLFLAAYQSHLWNKMLDRWFRVEFASARLCPVSLKQGSLVMPQGLSLPERDRLQSLELPFPSSRLKLEAGSWWEAVTQSVMAEEGLSLAAMKLKHLREVFFSKGERAIWFLPQELTWQTTPSGKPGQHDLGLRFSLPRGCYATMLIKRITAKDPPSR